MRIFLDTNVLASALATRGMCADVMREVLSFHELLLSARVCEELDQVLRKKLRVPAPIAAEVAAFLKREATTVPPAAPVTLDLREKADRLILGEALAGGAEIFVTGDKELQGVRRISALRVLSPRQFWELLRS